MGDNGRTNHDKRNQQQYFTPHEHRGNQENGNDNEVRGVHGVMSGGLIGLISAGLIEHKSNSSL